MFIALRFDMKLQFQMTDIESVENWRKIVNIC